MTLTSILPSLRRTIPDPLRADRWPAHTTACTDDLVIRGVSLNRLIGLCGTPCVHTADAPGLGRGRSAEECAVACYTVVGIRFAGEQRTVDLDGTVEGIGAWWSEARLLGRASTSRDAEALVARTGRRGAGCEAATLPVDLAVGDRIAVPCREALSLHDLRY